jgi:hypothetical protein
MVFCEVFVSECKPMPARVKNAEKVLFLMAEVAKLNFESALARKAAVLEAFGSLAGVTELTPAMVRRVNAELRKV